MKSRWPRSRRGSGLLLLLSGLLTLVMIHLTVQSRDILGLLRHQRELLGKMHIADVPVVPVVPSSQAVGQ